MVSSRYRHAPPNRSGFFAPSDPGSNVRCIHKRQPSAVSSRWPCAAAFLQGNEQHCASRQHLGPAGTVSQSGYSWTSGVAGTRLCVQMPQDHGPARSPHAADRTQGARFRGSTKVGSRMSFGILSPRSASRILTHGKLSPGSVRLLNDRSPQANVRLSSSA
jgi:hypothetical protein